MRKPRLLVAPMIADANRRASWERAERAWLAGNMATIDRIEDELRAVDPRAFATEVAAWLAGTDAAGNA